MSALCWMLLRGSLLRDWPVVPAVAGDWALEPVAGPGALFSLLCAAPPASPARTPPHTPALGSIMTPSSWVIVNGLVRTGDTSVVLCPSLTALQRQTSRHSFANYPKCFLGVQCFRIFGLPCLCLECLQPRADGPGPGE